MTKKTKRSSKKTKKAKPDDAVRRVAAAYVKEAMKLGKEEGRKAAKRPKRAPAAPKRVSRKKRAGKTAKDAQATKAYRMNDKKLKEQLKKTRLEAGRKAAETRRANARRGPGRPRKSAVAQSSKEQELVNVVTELGVSRSEQILKKMREVAREV